MTEGQNEPPEYWQCITEGGEGSVLRFQSREYYRERLEELRSRRSEESKPQPHLHRVESESGRNSHPTPAACLLESKRLRAPEETVSGKSPLDGLMEVVDTHLASRPSVAQTNGAKQELDPRITVLANRSGNEEFRERTGGDWITEMSLQYPKMSDLLSAMEQSPSLLECVAGRSQGVDRWKAVLARWNAEGRQQVEWQAVTGRMTERQLHKCHQSNFP